MSYDNRLEINRTIVPSDYGRFSLDCAEDKLAAVKFLDENGYVIIKDVADEQSRAIGLNLLWDFLENQVPGSSVKRNDPESWIPSSGWTPSISTGLLNGLGFGQSKFMWHSRLLPKVSEIFEAIWGTDDLIVSFDGGNVFRPWRYRPDYVTRSAWWHLDQNGASESSSTKRSIQGLLSYYDATESTGGLCVIPRSHLFHHEICQRSKVAPTVSLPIISLFFVLLIY